MYERALRDDEGLLAGPLAEKLERAADNVRSEGWKWSEVAIDFPYGHTYGLRRISGESVAMTGEEVAAAEALRAEYERLEQETRSRIPHRERVVVKATATDDVAVGKDGDTREARRGTGIEHMH